MAQRSTTPSGHIVGAQPRAAEAFPAATVSLVASLHDRFDARRRALLEARQARQVRLDSKREQLDFRADTAAIRDGDWRVADVPAQLRRRQV